MNADGSPFRADYPDGTSTSREIIVNLLFDFIKAIAGGNYFDGQVGRSIPEFLRNACFWNPLFPHESNIRSAHSIRVGCKLEPCLRPENLTKIILFNILVERCT